MTYSIYIKKDMRRLIWKKATKLAVLIALVVSGVSSSLMAQDLLVDLDTRVEMTGAGNAGDYVADFEGNTYFWTSFFSTITFESDTGTVALTSVGNADNCLAKIDRNGHLLWAKQFGSTLADRVWNVKIDKDNNVYLSGEYSADFDANPDVGSTYQLKHDSTNNNADGFVIKLDSDGNFIWANSITGEYVFGWDLSVVGKSHVYMLIENQATSKINTSMGEVASHASQGGTDALLVCFDGNGQYKWSDIYGGTDFESSLKLASDAAANVYISMRTRGYYDLDPGAGVDSVNTLGGFEPVIFKVDSSGAYQQKLEIGGPGFIDFTQALAVSESGTVYTMMYLEPTNYLKFQMDTGAVQYTNSTSSDIAVLIAFNDQFIAKWVKEFDPIGSFYYEKMEVDGAYLYFNGFLYGSSTYDLDPGLGSFLIGTSTEKASLSKFDTNGVFIDAYLWDEAPDFNVLEDTIYLHGIINSTFDIDPSAAVHFLIDTAGSGNAPFYLTKLTPCGSNDYTNVSVCDSFTLNSIKYTSTGSYLIDSALNVHGCDSLEHLELTILKSSSSLLNLIECFSYESPSGKYVWDASGIYNDTISNNAGCDSIMQIDLLIKTVDTSVTLIKTTLWTDSSGDAYQWLDCDDNLTSVGGAISASYTPLVSGKYAVEIELDGCIDTSGCFEITVLTDGVLKELLEAELKVYPNPSNGTINITLDEKLLGAQITMKTIDGRIIYQSTGQNKLHIELGEILSSGMYFLSVETKDYSVLNRKIIVK